MVGIKLSTESKERRTNCRKGTINEGQLSQPSSVELNTYEVSIKEIRVRVHRRKMINQHFWRQVNRTMTKALRPSGTPNLAKSVNGYETPFDQLREMKKLIEQDLSSGSVNKGQMEKADFTSSG